MRVASARLWAEFGVRKLIGATAGRKEPALVAQALKIDAGDSPCRESLAYVNALPVFDQMSPLAHFGVAEDEWLSRVCDGITASASRSIHESQNQ
jgi:hypothetical protein